MGMANVQLDRQYATDVKRKDAGLHTPKWKETYLRDYIDNYSTIRHNDRNQTVF